MPGKVNGQMSTLVEVDDWRFHFDNGPYIEIECLSRPYGRRHIPCPPFMRHSDVEMFARGWVACFENVSYFTD